MNNVAIGRSMHIPSSTTLSTVGKPSMGDPITKKPGLGQLPQGFAALTALCLVFSGGVGLAACKSQAVYPSREAAIGDIKLQYSAPDNGTIEVHDERFNLPDEDKDCKERAGPNASADGHVVATPMKDGVYSAPGESNTLCKIVLPNGSETWSSLPPTTAVFGTGE